MRFDRRYDLYAFLGRPDATLPWIATSWARIAAALDPLVLAARDRAAVRTTQFDPSSAKSRVHSFGRIGWNKRGAAKWTHATEGMLLSGTRARFLTCEMWAPSWTVCERDGRSPDVYFAMRDHHAWAWSKTPLSFRACGFVAVAQDMPTVGDAVRGAAVEVARAFDAVLFAHLARAWGEPFGDIGFSNAINDLIPAGALLGSGSLESDLSPSALKGPWVPIALR